MSCTRIYIGKPRYGARGPVFTARLGSPTSQILIKSSTEPLLAGSRALLSLGIIGRVELWDDVLPYPRMFGDIGRLAQLTVREDSDSFPRFEKYRPPPGTGGRTVNRTGRPSDNSEAEVGVLGSLPDIAKPNG